MQMLTLLKVKHHKWHCKDQNCTRMSDHQVGNYTLVLCYYVLKSQRIIKSKPEMKTSEQQMLHIQQYTNIHCVPKSSDLWLAIALIYMNQF